MEIKLEDKYYSKKEIKEVKREYLEQYQRLVKKKMYLLFHKKARKFCKTYRILEEIINEKNQKILKEKQQRYQSIFQNINGYTLDEEQQKAILKEEEAHLVIAGAGSGKTLTMIGKIKYLVEVKGISKEKILCLSFTNATVKDFTENVYQSLGYTLDILTFHKLGLKILKENRVPVSISKENMMSETIDRYFEKHKTDKEFLKNIMKIYGDNLEEVKKLIFSFLNLFKGSGYEDEDWDRLKEKASREKNRIIKRKNLFLLAIMKDIYLLYEKDLEEKGQIDFHDMLKYAISLLKEGYHYPEYDYIIVDEYQDTSYLRYLLLKELKDKNNCPILAVGDDWQSIYRFTGCNVELFTKFNHYFSNSSLSFLQNTYRNSQQLIDVAGGFVMKNKSQLQKNLKSPKILKKPIKIYSYKSKIEIQTLLEKILPSLEGKTILLLGRNNSDIRFLEENYDFQIDGETVILKEYPQVKMRFLTVHKSKGLQSDIVIILNLEDTTLGFPNKIADDPIINYIVEKDHFEYEEERRLFYVALTRTKNEVYLFVPKEKPSIFVEELRRGYRNDIEEL